MTDRRHVDGIPAGPFDVVIVGSGMGGGTLAYALRDAGVRVLLVERGDFIPSEPENWDVDAVHVAHRYRARDPWQKADGRSFQPGMHYAVGGNTKVFGASLPRFLPSDFGEVRHADGTSPAWPFTYDDLAPHYSAAERIYGVHGEPEPGRPDARDTPFPFPPVPHEPAIAEVERRLSGKGYTPAHLPLGIDLRADGTCVRCGTCDAFVCRLDAKADADVRCVRPALASGSVQIATRTFAREVLTDATGRRAAGVVVERDGEATTIAAGVVVVACGAINSASLLLRSASERHPHGLANGSGVVGRHLMLHNNTVMLAVDPRRRNDATYTKTLYVNDFYERGTEDHPFPLGHMQLIGKVREQMVREAMRPAPRFVRRYTTDHSWDWWLFTEDLPDPENRVSLAGGTIRVAYTPNNEHAHRVLVREAKRMVHAAGFPIALSRRQDIDAMSHQAGTVRMGNDPTTSAIDLDCRAHELDNLFVVDASFFPSLPVMNPALTVAANALRVAPRVAAAAAARRAAHDGVSAPHTQTTSPGGMNDT